MFKTVRKQFLAVACVIALCLSISTAFASANDVHAYAINGTGNGPNVWLTEDKKEYTDVTVLNKSGSGNLHAVVSLWWHNWPYADKWYPDNQSLAQGTYRRAWWYGGPAGDYHIYQECLEGGSSVVGSYGTFQNFS